MQLADLVNEAHTVDPTATVVEAARRMADADVGSLAVMQGGRLIGIFTERDLLRSVASGHDLDTHVVGNAMTASPDVAPPDIDVETAARWMAETGYRHLPVVGDDLAGIISIRDLMMALLTDDAAPDDVESQTPPEPHRED